MQIRLSGKKQGSMKIWHFCKILAFSAQLHHFDHKSSGFGRLSKKIEDLEEKKDVEKMVIFSDFLGFL